MCRIALFNRAALPLFGSKLPPLVDFLTFLEQRKGGDGNGLALVDAYGKVKVWKGLTDTHPVSFIAKLIGENPEANWFVFHTRKASPGLPVIPEQAHPFRMGPYVLCMNGTEDVLIPLAKDSGLTDTELVLAQLVLQRLPPIFLLGYHSNFAGFYNGQAFVVRNRGVDLKLFRDSRAGAIVFASEFPDEVKELSELPPDYYWFEGDNLPC
ncbi:hypothetical protein HPY42_00210 [Coprothermobacteraceae bacterium]|nr:hypothetical protein [Coprothermobacteraceae bacterium]